MTTHRISLVPRSIILPQACKLYNKCKESFNNYKKLSVKTYTALLLSLHYNITTRKLENLSKSQRDTNLVF